MILFINACVRPGSRTRQLADRLLKRLAGEEEIKEVDLAAFSFPKADNDFIDLRSGLVERGDYSHPMFDPAKLFAAADVIVVAAPYWDLSFPAALKQYLEQICVLGVTFYYENDMPKGLCRAKKLYYVTTAGGPVFSDEYGYGYVKTLAQIFFGIPETEQIKAQGLDLFGADVESIMEKAKREIDELVI